MIAITENSPIERLNRISLNVEIGTLYFYGQTVNPFSLINLERSFRSGLI
jgi:hypothetical protein